MDCFASLTMTRGSSVSLSRSASSNAISCTDRNGVGHRMFLRRSASSRHHATFFAAIAAFASITTPLSAAEFGPPPNAVLSLDKLSKIDDFINDQVAKGNIPGAIVLIQRHGKPAYFS